MQSKILSCILCGMLLLAWPGCRNTPDNINRTAVIVTLKLPENLMNANPVLLNEGLVYSFKNISTGQVFTFAETKAILLPEGLYDCFFEGWLSSGTSDKIKIKAYAPSLQILGSSVSIELKSFKAPAKSGFVFEELFFTGVLTPQGKQYHGCSYFKIRNNSDKLLYADSLVICESRFISTQKWDYQPDIRSQAMPVFAVYMIPGKGKDVPVKPGESLLIADIAIDHRKANLNAYNLSRANFEWFDNSSRPSIQDTDNPLVPNLDKIYCYTLSIWVPHNRGFRSYALARMKTDKDSYLRDYIYEYSYVMKLPSGVFPMTGKGYKMPNAWMEDVVNCSIESDYVWNLVDPSLDTGWTYVSKIDHDKTRYNKSVRRKIAYVTREGLEILQDTNNSSDDFIPAAQPSMK